MTTHHLTVIRLTDHKLLHEATISTHAFVSDPQFILTRTHLLHLHGMGELEVLHIPSLTRLQRFNMGVMDEHLMLSEIQDLDVSEDGTLVFVTFHKGDEEEGVLEPVTLMLDARQRDIFQLRLPAHAVAGTRNRKLHGRIESSIYGELLAGMIVVTRDYGVDDNPVHDIKETLIPIDARVLTKMRKKLQLFLLQSERKPEDFRKADKHLSILEEMDIGWDVLVESKLGKILKRLGKTEFNANVFPYEKDRFDLSARARAKLESIRRKLKGSEAHLDKGMEDGVGISPVEKEPRPMHLHPARGGDDGSNEEGNETQSVVAMASRCALAGKMRIGRGRAGGVDTIYFRQSPIIPRT
ncbi:hypothetical protein HDV00_007964 [Rhizophlyctis rosea]|nr:hypothetical protein HDV00_007964 [Rhizophlyctis rosea]